MTAMDAGTADQGAVAAVDLGTNSTRLLVVGADGAVLARDATVTRLGAGVDRARNLASDAIDRTCAALARYRSVLEEHGVAPDRMRAVATSAARDAANREALFDAAERALGVRPELLAGADEGRLAFAGATSWLQPRKNGFGEPAYDVVLDIGGGSTELIVGRPGEDPVGVHSLDIGCVRITEQLLHSDPPEPEELSGVVTVARAHMEDLVRELPVVKQADRMIGVAGTITTVAAVEMGLATYDRSRTHGFVLSRAAAEDVFRTLATESSADRAHNPGLPADRVATIVGGAAILVSVLRFLDLQELVVSETDILDGVVASLRR